MTNEEIDEIADRIRKQWLAEFQHEEDKDSAIARRIRNQWIMERQAEKVKKIKKGG